MDILVILVRLYDRLFNEAHPDAIVMVHPECVPEVQEKADHVLSTGQMCDMAAELEATEFIIGTESGINHTLKTRIPEKDFYPVMPQPVCPNMKKINLNKVLASLRDEVHEVKVDPAIADKAKASIDRMLEMS